MRFPSAGVHPVEESGFFEVGSERGVFEGAFEEFEVGHGLHHPHLPSQLLKNGPEALVFLPQLCILPLKDFDFLLEFAPIHGAITSRVPFDIHQRNLLPSRHHVSV